MELVWLIVQALVLCAALLAVTCGLMFAPWYVLLVALGIVLVAIQQLVAGLKGETEPAAPNVQKNSALARPHSSTETAQAGSTEQLLATPQPTHLIYRGIDYIIYHESKKDSV